VKWTLVGVSLAFFTLFLLMPLFAVFYEALRKGWDVYFAAHWSSRTRCPPSS
jgi:sulfate transport system permease protein